jgi:hypothetical protein
MMGLAFAKRDDNTQWKNLDFRNGDNNSGAGLADLYTPLWFKLDEPDFSATFLRDVDRAC